MVRPARFERATSWFVASCGLCILLIFSGLAPRWSVVFHGVWRSIERELNATRPKQARTCSGAYRRFVSLRVRVRRRRCGWSSSLVRSECMRTTKGPRRIALSHRRIFGRNRENKRAWSSAVISPAVRTKARTPALTSAIISFGRLVIALSLVRTIHPFSPATVSHSGSETAAGNLSARRSTTHPQSIRACHRIVCESDSSM